MSSGGPDLFVVCKSCHSEVSPYITECPYCGARLRKRAPKLDKEGRIADRARGRRGRARTKRTAPRPSLGRLRAGEIPGIRGEDHRPWGTAVLVVAGLVLLLLGRTTLDVSPLLVGQLVPDDAYRWFTSSFFYANTGYAFIALTAIAIFGWLLERRHGLIVVLLLAVLAGAAGMALASEVSHPLLAIGGNGMALGLIVAWLVPDVLAWRQGEEIEGDLLGAVVFGVVVAVVPAFVPEAAWLAGLGGAVVGLLSGLALSALSRPAV